MQHPQTRRTPRQVVLLAIVAAVVAIVSPVAARPPAMKIFPKETLGFVRIAHARETFDKIRATSIGRMLDDPQIRPLVERLYASAKTAYEEDAQEEIGLSLDEFWQIPQGEIALGLVGRELGNPTFAILIDLGDESTAAHKLLDRVLEAMVDEGGARSLETIGELEVTVVRVDDEDIEAVVFIEREDTLLVVADLALAKQMLALWDAAETGEPIVPPPAADEGTSGEDEEDSTEAEEDPYWVESLAENQQFVSIMRHCRTAGDDPPQILFFVDPIEIFRHFARGEAGMAIALATLPSLGLDGVRGVGGSITYGTEKYDSLSHMHLLLDNPRAGVLSMLNLRNGDMTPESWVPDSVETYMTGHWDVPLTYEKLIALYDSFQYEGAFVETIERNINEPTGLNFREEIIGQAAGRFTLLLGFPRPARLRQRSILFAVEVRDADSTLATIEKLIALDPEESEERTFGGVTYWVPAGLVRMYENQGTSEEEAPVMPCWGVVDGYVMVGTSTQLFESAITARDGTSGRLADAIDYELICSRIRRQSAEPGLVMFNRPEETLRFVYELATSEENREQLRSWAEDEEVAAVFNDALEENPLPPFEVIAKYLAPAGGLVTDTETGFHFLSFGLRREE